MRPSYLAIVLTSFLVVTQAIWKLGPDVKVLEGIAKQTPCVGI